MWKLNIRSIEHIEHDIEKCMWLHSSILSQKDFLPRAEYERLMEEVWDKMQEIISKIH